MGRKIDPRLYRLNINKDWNSHWFAPKGKFGPYLKADETIRDIIVSLFLKGVIEKVVIERSLDILKIVIFTPRPGLVVGKQGSQIREIEAKVKSFVNEGSAKPIKVTLEIQEVSDPETHASIVADEVANQLEKRMPYKRVLKQALGRIMRNKIAKGAKIKIKGRLGGADIARVEWVFEGSVPLQTLRSDIDYGFSEAITKWGAVGVKVWIYKGQVFKKATEEEEV